MTNKIEEVKVEVLPISDKEVQDNPEGFADIKPGNHIFEEPKWVKFNPKTSPTKLRVPKLSNNQAAKCDRKLHTWGVFKIPNKADIMCCIYCGGRKGGLPPIKMTAAQTKVAGSSSAKGSLTAKKT